MHRLGRSSRTVGANALRAVGASLRNRSSVKVKLGHIPILPITATDAGLPGIAKRTYAAKEGKGPRTAILDLVNAASQGDLASVKRFIEQDGLDVNSADYDKRSVLHLAAAEGRTDVVKYLLSKSVNVNVVDRFNRTPLEDALKGGHTEVAGLLRAKGATASKTQLELTADMCFAAGQGDVKELQILIEAGGDINKTDSVGRTPLHVAAAEGHVTAIEFLVKRGANVNSVDRYGNTALMEAKRGRGRGHRACAKVLEENGGVVSSGPAFTGTNFQTSLQSSLPILCDRGKFLYVQTWLPAKEGQEFVATDWYAQKDFVAHLAGVRVSSDTAEFSDKSSPLFHVYKEKKPVYIPNVAADKSSRYKAAMDSGIKSCVVIPIVHQGDVTAILKFFSDESPQLSDQDLSTFSQFASNLVTAGVYGTSRAPRFTEVKDIPESQMQEVFKMIVDEGVFNANLVYHEVDWFYNMGLQVHYFRVHPARVLANHIHSLIAAKKSAATSGTPEHIWLGLENNPKLLGGSGPEQALYMIPNLHPQIAAVERALSKRIGLIPAHKPYTLEMFLSQRPHTPNGQTKLAIYVLQTNNYVNPSKLGSKETDIWEISSDAFQRDKTKSIRERYQEIINEASPKLSPVAKVYELYRDGTVPIMLAFHKGQGNTSSVMMQLTELLKQQDLEPTRKFIEVFANGIIVFSLYLKPCPQKKIDNLLQQYSLLHLIPYSALTPKFLSGEWTAEEYTYASAVSRFIFYFINQRSEEFEVLSNHLKNDPLNLARLRLLHTSLKREAVSQIRINETLLARADLTKELFRDFQTRVTTDQIQQRLPANAALLKRIKNEATSQLDEQILQAILTFNQHVRKTNFYKQKKSALSFRLDPAFLKGGEWPQVPFGVFFVLGSEFQGFHIRFEDVARGGIRIVRSRDQAAYNKNLGTLFAENYGLAFTQNRKNKDIPEFGSKGTVLLNVDSQAEANAMMSFQKYCSGVLDLIINHKEVRDNLGKPELLFFGPDEGTADKMEWACLYAQRKGYPYWRSFTTGKPPALGGIPHDTYGMTTTSVHKYVVGCLNRLGLDETKVTKIQTGGPDGDLGSNEILLSKDKTKAVIDGSGVLYDEDGINREELVRLAKKRVMIKEFDVKKLSPKGFRVLVTENNVKLPNGDIVENGVAFRNEFHLHPLATADMFVPCGGRPESVNLSNVKQLLHKDGKPKFRIVVEGANLFFTQDARMVLENAGVVLYKDASANKGGVTSSSLEVLAALALDDAEFDKHMAVKDPKRPPAFYEEYVKEIQRRIENDAELEFKCIWAEHERSGKHRYLLTDEVSEKINTLNKFVAGSKLWDNLDVRTAVLRQAIPQKLQQLKPLDAILQRVPPNYTKAIFAAYLASRYVYQYGISANEFAFFEFMDQFLKKDK